MAGSPRPAKGLGGQVRKQLAGHTLAFVNKKRFSFPHFKRLEKLGETARLPQSQLTAFLTRPSGCPHPQSKTVPGQGVPASTSITASCQASASIAVKPAVPSIRHLCCTPLPVGGRQCPSLALGHGPAPAHLSGGFSPTQHAGS